METGFKQLENYLEAFNILSNKEIRDFVHLGNAKCIEKGDFIIKEGAICKEVAFVNSGISRSYYYSSSEEELTYCFTFPNNFIAAYSSYISQTETVENIQALTKMELFVISKSEINKLEKTGSNWMLFFKTMAEYQYIELEKRIFVLQKEKAKKRYEDLLKEKPEYLQFIPLNYLASYLGITQRHLSRIRKELSI